MVWWFPSAAAGARRGAFPLDPMEYVCTEGTAADYDVMYDTVHALPADPKEVAQSEHASVTTWSTQRNIVRTSDGTIYVVYYKYLAGIFQIYVIKSEDDGATWTDDTHISTTVANMSANHQYVPCIAVDSRDRLHIVWEGESTDYPNKAIWYALYDGSWHTPICISTYVNMTLQDQWRPVIAVDSQDNLHVVWMGRATGYPNLHIWYNKYTDSWAGPVHISTDCTYGNDPCIAVDSQDRLHVVFTGGAADFATRQVRYAKYDGSWSTPIRISTTANMSANHYYLPCIAVDSLDQLHVVWYGKASPPYDTDDQIWYAMAVPPYAAGDWVAPIRISDALNMTLQDQTSPSIAVDSNDYLHVVWSGKATGFTAQNVVWLAVYVASWAEPVCIQPTGRNQFPVLRWSRWPR